MNLRKFLWAGLCGASLIGAVNPVVANAALDVYSNHRRQPSAMRLCPPLVAAISGCRATGMDGAVVTSGLRDIGSVREKATTTFNLTGSSVITAGESITVAGVAVTAMATAFRTALIARQTIRTGSKHAGRSA